MLHKNIPVEDRHATHNYEYANAAARTGATGFQSSDLHKLALQLDDGTYWRLASTTPTWVAFGAAGPQGPAGPAGPAGDGAGDMLKSDNLSGLANYPAARTNLGLGNVDNTSDANKPVSSAQAAADSAAQAAAIAASAPSAHVGAGGAAHALAVASGAAGFLSGSDKAKLDATSGTNTGDNAANTNYANDYRVANFVAGTNYLAPAAIGTTVQAYDANSAKTDVAQNWVASQRSANIPDNDGSFDLSGAGNNYASAPTSAVAITFTNIAANAGKSGYITLTNGSNYAYTAHTNTKIATTDLAKIVVSGTYVLPYLCDGTDVFILGVWTKP